MRIIVSLVLCIFPWIHTFSYCPIRDSLLAIANKEVGVLEVTENDGPRIREYQDSAKTYRKAPWCAAFITWCYKKLNLNIPELPARAASWTEKNQIVHYSEVMPGDVATIYYSKLGRVGHGFIIEAADADYVYTIEGNTNYGGWDYEGDRVMKKMRPWSTIYAFSNWIGDKSHTIAPGDNLYNIAKRYKTTPERLRILNNVKNNYIRVGDILTIYCGKT